MGFFLLFLSVRFCVRACERIANGDDADDDIFFFYRKIQSGYIYIRKRRISDPKFRISIVFSTEGTGRGGVSCYPQSVQPYCFARQNVHEPYSTVTGAFVSGLCNDGC